MNKMPAFGRKGKSRSVADRTGAAIPVEKKCFYGHPHADKRVEGFEKKYKIIDKETGEEVKSAFVLFPERDSAARAALGAYQQATRNPNVAKYIGHLLREIRQARAERARGRREIKQRGDIEI